MLKIGAKQEMKGEADWSKPRNELRPVKKIHVESIESGRRSSFNLLTFPSIGNLP